MIRPDKIGNNISSKARSTFLLKEGKYYNYRINFTKGKRCLCKGDMTKDEGDRQKIILRVTSRFNLIKFAHSSLLDYDASR